MKPQAFIFMGRAGSGKGTQAQMLIELLKKRDETRNVIYVETGAEFRKFMSGDGFTAKHSKAIVDKGFLMPVFMCVHVWGNHFIKEYTGNEHVVFDGTPRKLLEAKVLEDLFPFYGIEAPWVIYLDVEHDESTKRLSLRATKQNRVDDSKEGIDRRLKLFEDDIKPTIEWYKTNPNVKFLDINGERSVEEIHADIVKRLRLV